MNMSVDLALSGQAFPYLGVFCQNESQSLKILVCTAFLLNFL